MKLNTVLTIAGSDCSGGAGIQADLKTFTVHGLYGMSVVTALTAQNTQGVYGIQEVTPEFVKQQIDCVFEDIPPQAVKIGMVSSVGIIKAIAEALRKHNAGHVVCDPVMISTSGGRLLEADAISNLTSMLFPLAELITPNIPEAEVLSGMEIHQKKDMEKAAGAIWEKSGVRILLKGGHLAGDSDDLFFDGKEVYWFTGSRIENTNTHGTGCTLSSAIACHLAKGMPLSESVAEAKKYITGALEQRLDLGKGSGPLDHMYRIRLATAALEKE